jgi:hypothetical protein
MTDGEAAQQDTDADTGPGEDFHRKFREALDRKKHAKHADNGPHDAGEKGHALKDVKVKREFRRKSG